MSVRRPDALDRSVAEMTPWRKPCPPTRFHIFSHSWGWDAGTAYVLDKAPDAVGDHREQRLLPGTDPDLVENAKSCLDVATRSAIDRHGRPRHATHSAEYQAAIRSTKI